LLHELKAPQKNGEARAQVFLTTHSP
jgi:hypothetical protein